MKIYIDSDFKCHTTNNGTMTEAETIFFDGKCQAFIEGYRYIPSGKHWTRSDGIVFTGEMVSPWKSYSELDNAQREYERQKLVEYKEAIAELDAALLETQYQNLIGGL